MRPGPPLRVTFITTISCVVRHPISCLRPMSIPPRRRHRKWTPDHSFQASLDSIPRACLSVAFLHAMSQKEVAIVVPTFFPFLVSLHQTKLVVIFHATCHHRILDAIAVGGDGDG